MSIERVPDKTILNQINQRLSRTGTGGQCRVVATVLKGVVTLSGTIQYDYQRKHVLRTASGVSGVGRVEDRLQVMSHKRY
jgi:osmotically-inducible protein OsmY